MKARRSLTRCILAVLTGSMMFQFTSCSPDISLPILQATNQATQLLAISLINGAFTSIGNPYIVPPSTVL